MQIITSLDDSGHGLCLAKPGFYHISDTIIDLSGTNPREQDEALSITWGASGHFERCLIRGAGRLILIGSGDTSMRKIEEDCSVSFVDCIFENCGRRAVEVQSGMHVSLTGCLIRNWGDPAHFITWPDWYYSRAFALWAHHGGSAHLNNCGFWQDSLSRPLWQRVMDWGNHVGQAVNDYGYRALFDPRHHRAGVRRAVTRYTGTQERGYLEGTVYAKDCWVNDPRCIFEPNSHLAMPTVAGSYTAALTIGLPYAQHPAPAPYTPEDMAAFIKRVEKPFTDYYAHIRAAPANTAGTAA